ncbi:hypothetical protein NDU88_004994 [Pleurodeles waltl]|uniref:Uncharacterized protein n=1 Tax=Pleurodeles waltl TaxID=8319 RepID=A0AAV7L101_PLEWA|nr:hypothetical protein NDU88_004994 [Pleurodeles waltl]
MHNSGVPVVFPVRRSNDPEEEKEYCIVTSWLETTAFCPWCKDRFVFSATASYAGDSEGVRVCPDIGDKGLKQRLGNADLQPFTIMRANGELI